ncbi:MAG: monovalent cation/H(+) antiporter subunit G [Salinibacterium sp.]|nr:monovalent cation/H(+) antiporter subunit G [Salinibacterium sp.]MBF0673530.1 monovalent cation/H(+) antiporter subunit G [Salinibacterium sp.]
MTLDSFLDQLAAIFLVGSGLFSLAAGIGLLRFPDVLARMHAATKPQVVGLMLVLGAIALAERSWAVLLTLLPVLLFQMLTAPISAHMIGRAGYRAGNIDDDHLYVDELDEAIDEAQEERARHERESGG